MTIDERTCNSCRHWRQAGNYTGYCTYDVASKHLCTAENSCTDWTARPRENQPPSRYRYHFWVQDHCYMTGTYCYERRHRYHFWVQDHHDWEDIEEHGELEECAESFKKGFVGSTFREAEWILTFKERLSAQQEALLEKLVKTPRKDRLLEDLKSEPTHSGDAVANGAPGSARHYYGSDGHISLHDFVYDSSGRCKYLGRVNFSVAGKPETTARVSGAGLAGDLGAPATELPEAPKATSAAEPPPPCLSVQKRDVVIRPEVRKARKK